MDFFLPIRELLHVMYFVSGDFFVKGHIHGGPKKVAPLGEFSSFSISAKPIVLKLNLVILQHILHKCAKNC